MLNELTLSELRRSWPHARSPLARPRKPAWTALPGSMARSVRSSATTRRDALAQADAADQRLAAGAQAPLLGVPIAIKDVIAVKGQPLNCGSKILGKFISPYDATVIEKLKAAGAIVFGRLNMDEFAMGSSTENSAFQITRNPWDTTRIPGGSSGGSAAAVAADECIAALGSDTGGSIRQPAALCGCVGLKPSYGRVSRYGLVAFASSLDQIGCFAKDVRDAATVLERYQRRWIHAIRPACRSRCRITPPGLTGDIKGLKLGSAQGIHGRRPGSRGEGGRRRRGETVRKDWARKLWKFPCRTRITRSRPTISSPPPRPAPTWRASTASATACAWTGADPIELYGKTRGAGFGPEVKRRIILGTYVLSSGYYDAYYLRAQKVRTLIRQDFLKAFEKVDAILTPTSPTAAFKIGEKADDPLQMYLMDIFTISAISPAFAASASRADSPRHRSCRLACNCSANRSARRQFCDSPTPTNRPRRGTAKDRRCLLNKWLPGAYC